MGRRSINTTKSGKYMNPTDQARKEARKKELKKNKKQRAAVRAAVLKGKDPVQLLEEMEKIDEMEYNVFQPSPLNEKVLKDKRKKLKETLDRVMRLYHQDDPETWAEMKRKEVEYEKRKFKRVQLFESVRHAEQVQLDEIPLPSASEKPTPSALPKINLPPPVLLTNVPPPSILKKQNQIEEPTLNESKEDKEKEPPGVPPTPPVDLFSLRELDSDYEESDTEMPEEEEEIPMPKNKSRRYSDEAENKESDGEVNVPPKLSSISTQNIDEFMKEMENVQKKKDEERTLEIKRVDPTPDVEDIVEKPVEPTAPPSAKTTETKAQEAPTNIPPMPSIVLPPPMPAGIPAPPLMFRPGLFRPGIPAPPMRPGLRMPPGPPTGPRPMHAMRGPPMGGPHHSKHHPGQSQSKDPKSATITAKPQIRNLSADVTRFVPTTLRVKRDDSYKKPKPTKMFHEVQTQQQVNKGPTKDDAYMQFMNEMQGLL